MLHIFLALGHIYSLLAASVEEHTIPKYPPLAFASSCKRRSSGAREESHNKCSCARSGKQTQQNDEVCFRRSAIGTRWSVHSFSPGRPSCLVDGIARKHGTTITFFGAIFKSSCLASVVRLRNLGRIVACDPSRAATDTATRLRIHFNNSVNNTVVFGQKQLAKLQLKGR